MKDLKKLLKLLFPPLWVIIPLIIISAVSLTLIFVKGLEEHPVSYAAYVVAFYTLTAAVLYCSMVLPSKYKKIKQKVYDSKYGNRYVTDAVYRFGNKNG